MNIELIEGWQRFYKMYSIQFLALIAALPEIYDLAVSYNIFSGGVLPEKFSAIVKVMAFMAAVSRLVKQKSLTAQPTPTADAK
jgi:hypothetical protein